MSPPARGLSRAARREGDRDADALVASLAERGLLDRADDCLERVVRNDDPCPRGTPSQLASFLRRAALPAWADAARVARGQRFAARHVGALAAALFCAALPQAFTGVKGTRVLAFTGRLRDDVDRRVNETGRFVFEVVMPGGLDPSGTGVRACQKVRLLHASVRRAANAYLGADEVPINQEDLVGTLVCFSVVVLDAMERMGTRFTRAEAEDYFELWRVIGAMLGIGRRHLPRSLEHARRVGDAIRARESGASRDGRELAGILVDGIERHLPARGLGVVAPGLLRFFLGDGAGLQLALREGVRVADVAAWLPRVGQAIGSWTAAIPLAERLTSQIERAALDAVIARKLGDQAPSYGRPLASAARTCPRGAPARASGGPS